MVFLVLYLTRRGFSLQQAGAAVSLYGLGGLFASFLGGELADRFGRTRTIALSMFGSAAAILTLSQVNLLPLILPLALLAGTTSEAYRPASGALLADLVPAGQRVAAFAALRFMVNAAFALGAAVAGLLAQHSFFFLFVADASTSVVFGALALLAIREPPLSRPAERPAIGAGYRIVIADRGFLLFLLGAFLAAFVYLQSYSTFALQVKALGFSSAVFGGLISLNGLLIVFLELPLSAFTQHLPAAPIIASGFLLLGIGFAMVAFAGTLVLLVLAVIVWTSGEMLNSPMAGAFVADRAPPKLRGRYQGSWGMSWGLGLVFGPVIGASLFAWSSRGFWLLCGVLAVAGSALVLFSSRLPPPSVESNMEASDDG
jgi:MFS family permease